MKTIDVAPGVSICFKAGHEELAELMNESYRDARRLIGKTWNLKAPARLKYYVAESMPRFVFHSSSPIKKMLLLLFFPFWYCKAKKIWAIAGGWNMGGKNPVIAVKPPTLFKTDATSMGKTIYIDEPNDLQRFRRFVVHETVHAFSAYHRLPLWLNEGLAVVSEDRFNRSPVVQQNTLDRLRQKPADRGDVEQPGDYNQLSRMSEDNLIDNFVRGYWFTRYLEEAHPGLLSELLKQPLKGNREVIDARIAKRLGVPARELWAKADALIINFFTPK